MSELQPIEVEAHAAELKPPVDDKRPKMPEPLPVRLIAVGDVQLPAQSGLETAMDELYVRLLGFLREPDDTALIYQADNFRVCFACVEGLIRRECIRPLQVELRCLAELEKALIEREMEYVHQRGLTPGAASLLLRDPSGNWVEVTERREVM